MPIFDRVNEPARRHGPNWILKRFKIIVYPGRSGENQNICRVFVV